MAPLFSIYMRGLFLYPKLIRKDIGGLTLIGG